jgi:hypothetical protein
MASKRSERAKARTLKAALIALALTGAGAADMQSAAAAAKAGRVMFSIGDVTISDSQGAKRRTNRGVTVFSGDTIETKTRGRAQLRMEDGAFMSFSPNTTFRIDEYAFTKGGSGESDRGFFSLLRGGLRAITGAIGKKVRKNFRLSSPIATIGIRGTQFQTEITGSNQSIYVWEDPTDPLDQGVVVSPNATPGTSVAILPQSSATVDTAGNVQVSIGPQASSQLAPPAPTPTEFAAGEESNSDGEQSSVVGEVSGLVAAVVPPTDDTPPVVGPTDGTPPVVGPTDGTPPVVVGPTDGTPPVVVGPTDDTPPVVVVAPPDDTPVVPPVLSTQGNAVFHATNAEVPGNDRFAFASGFVDDGTAANNIGRDSARLTSFTQSNAGDCNPSCTMDEGTGTVVDAGSNAALGVEWGRITPGFNVSTPSQGPLVTTDSLHFVIANSLTSPANMPTSGVATYNQVIGGTGPSHFPGFNGPAEIGTHNVAITVNFAFSAISNFSVNGDFGLGRTFTASNFSLTPINSGGVTQLSLSGSCTTGLCGSNPNITGGARFGFVGPAAEGIAGSYGLQNTVVGGQPTRETVTSGTFVVTKP